MSTCNAWHLSVVGCTSGSFPGSMLLYFSPRRVALGYSDNHSDRGLEAWLAVAGQSKARPLHQSAALLLTYSRPSVRQSAQAQQALEQEWDRESDRGESRVAVEIVRE
jgi:hypothetical protein